ncbi:AMP-binding protein [Aliamphritea spongicola]|nr:AMP-binding protein [Aliamphritea spongicola]
MACVGCFYPALEIYTSGSSGAPAAIVKTIGQLEKESQALAELLSTDVKNEVILGTVSHQHFYGMTFRLFRSMTQSQPFDTTLCEYAETVISQSAYYESVCLVSSPALLARLNAALHWSEIAGKCSFVLSSAAALSAHASGQTHALINAPVIEIYGSSETGAVAWRNQQNSAVWQAIPGTELDADGDCLRVSASYLPAPTVLADKVKFVDGGFELLGRADRIVKVEGKRVSLTGIEKQLIRTGWVHEAKTIILERRRTEVAAVIELNEAGNRVLQDAGKKVLVRQLKDYLKTTLTRLPFRAAGVFPASCHITRKEN